MYQRKVVPKATLDEATANRQSAVVAYTEIHAPCAGVVTKRHAGFGDTVRVRAATGWSPSVAARR
jgi:multidrug resistance efflux pump